MADQSFLQAEQLWDKWTKEQDEDTAERLIKKYMYLVDFHVHRISVHLPGNVNKDDIKSLGLMGLYDALIKFDPDRNLKFDTYAAFRIRGVIIDGLRKEDWLPRSIRDRAKKLEQASQLLQQKYQRQPSSAELAEEVGISVDEVEEAVKDTLFANMLSMEEKPKDSLNEDKEGIGHVIPDNPDYSPESNLLRQERYMELEQRILQLNEKEQLVISLFYKEELTLTEIGEVLGLTTSRISQIHRKAIFKLKESLSAII
ncbi:FliA/WhiG family RNA polymerase sigma factor [Sediminibacillus massiliensis]|uniref:FliA/WhiG family RNA polymerase sigma factor n=1 Tax=Sediminibacillus massiliensis TaxID=1926277 RepID=UPI0009884A2B|nr:FliA/WhiG family RNA polymerase sigma factor [Sediminibacillus massiliensis]